ncbi:solute carrier organic anion transporter family member 2A1-like [Ptychodera flava]|uniref:solute carrier organic anion transporter family member 2A1-like n=1 Tax=Ptychodera flava TaxID=63121 RepID=UPI00396A07A8
MEVDKRPSSREDESRNSFLMEERSKISRKSGSDGQANLTDSDDYTCGIGSWRPRWLQVFANVKVAFVVIMLTTFMTTLNFASLSTAVVSWERQFALSSTIVGVCFTSLDISSIVATPLTTYFGGQATSHRPRWIGFGVLSATVGLLIIGSTQFISDLYEYGDMPSRSSNASSGLCFPSRTEHTTGVFNESFLDQAQSCDNVLAGNNLAALLCLFLGLLLLGAGFAPIFTLGISYIDDGLERKKAPLYFGILYSMYGLGPLIGYPMAGYFTSKFVDFYRVEESTVEIHKRDPRWVGAWWLGFFVNATLLLFAVIPLFVLPKKLRKPKEAEEGTEKVVEHIKEMTMSEKIKEFPRAMKRLLTNSTLMCIVAAITSEVALVGAVAPFATKYVINQFRTSVSLAAFVVPIGLVIPSTIGIFTGGVLLRRFKPTLKKIARNITIVHLACLLMIIPLMFVGCGNYKFAGINYSYPSSSNASDQGISTVNCNSKCMCPSNSPFNPVCGSDGVTYSSACHAGCAARQQTSGQTGARTFSRCSCVENPENGENASVELMMYSTEGTTINRDGAQTDDQLTTKSEHLTTFKDMDYNDTKTEMHNTTMWNTMVIQLPTHKPSGIVSPDRGAAYNPSDDGGTARPGICGEQCTNKLIVFTILLFCMSFMKSLPLTSSLEILLRSVKPADKPFALGVRAFFVQIFAWIPTSIYIGAIFDSACQYWGRNPCGDRGTCWVYDVDAYRLRYFAVIMFLKLLTTTFCLLAWFTLKKRGPTDREENGTRQWRQTLMAIPLNLPKCETPRPGTDRWYDSHEVKS